MYNLRDDLVLYRADDLYYIDDHTNFFNISASVSIMAVGLALVGFITYLNIKKCRNPKIVEATNNNQNQDINV